MGEFNLREPLLDVRQVAELLAVPTKSVYVLVKKRGLPVHYVGRNLRFIRGEVGAWVAQRGG